MKAFHLKWKDTREAVEMECKIYRMKENFVMQLFDIFKILYIYICFRSPKNIVNLTCKELLINTK